MDLIFVYNAKSGWYHSVLDSAHKLLKPSTYNCKLCALTHNVFTENKQWKVFRTTYNANFEFLHCDEFESAYNKTYAYPIILKKDSNQLEVVANRTQLNQLKTTQELIAILEGFS